MDKRVMTDLVGRSCRHLFAVGHVKLHPVKDRPSSAIGVAQSLNLDGR